MQNIIRWEKGLDTLINNDVLLFWSYNEAVRLFFFQHRQIKTNNQLRDVKKPKQDKNWLLKFQLSNPHRVKSVHTGKNKE